MDDEFTIQLVNFTRNMLYWKDITEQKKEIKNEHPILLTPHILKPVVPRAEGLIDDKYKLIDSFPFDTIRPAQQYIINQLEQLNNKKYIIIEAAVGTGKSAIAKMIAAHFDSAYILTATKQLQDQYMHEFKNLALIKGKSNYFCNKNGKNTKISCDQADCVFNPKIKERCSNNCNYVQAKNKALNTGVVVTSYAYFFTWLYRTQFMPRQVLICDECHLFVNMLIDWAEIKLNITHLQKKYNILKPNKIIDDKKIEMNNLVDSILEIKDHYQFGYTARNAELINNIFTLLNIHQKYIEKELISKNLNNTKSNKKISKNDVNKQDLLKNVHANLNWNITKHKDDKYSWKSFLSLKNELMQLTDKLKYFLKSNDKRDWVIAESLNEDRTKELIIKPLNIDNLFNEYIAKFGIKHVIFMSATILNPKLYYQELQLNKNNVGIISIDSTFDSKKSPIYFCPVANMTFRNTRTTEQFNNLINKLTKTIIKILNIHKNEKGIIHTGTYKIANALNESINDPRLTIKNDYENNSTLLNTHTNKQNSVLLSPSLGTGADLKDDLSRFQIIVKLPFSSLSDWRIKIKSELDYNWYLCEMFKNLIQMCGRSTRSENDYSDTYILDINFSKWIEQTQGLLPQSFLDRIIWDFDLDDINI